MNLSRRSDWIRKNNPNSYYKCADGRSRESDIEGSNVQSVIHEAPFISGSLHAAKDPAKISGAKSQKQLTRCACLYAISRDMLSIRCVEDLCRRLIGHMASVWRPCDRVFPYIEIDGRHFVQDESECLSAQKFPVPVMMNGEMCGQIGIFYKDSNVSLQLGDEDRDFLQYIATDLETWLRQQRQHEIEASSINDARMIENAVNEHAMIAITDKDGKIKYVNDKFCTVSKYEAEELIGSDHRVVNSGYHSREFFCDLWSTISRGKVWKGEIRNRAKDGSYYWVDTTIVPFLDGGGSPYQYIAIRTEVTEHKRLEGRMEERMTELARSNDELEQFAYIVTHDLQEPLRAINSFVQLLKRYCNDQLDDRANDLIAHAIGGTNRMQMLIDDLLTYAQVNASQAMVNIDCELLLSGVLMDLSVVIDECGAIVTHDKLPVVRGIPFQFIQLFTNLINNALKFKKAQPPKIHIGVEESRNEWVFSFSDNGIGIEEQYLERIFRVFQRLHSRKEYVGTGIGLAICKKVVEHHGGRIWVQSEPQAGSSFYFTIPKID